MQLINSPSKAEFHGSLASRYAHKRPHLNLPAYDVVVAYAKDVALFRPLTAKGHRYVSHFAPTLKTDHLTAYLLVDAMQKSEFRVKECGSPALPKQMVFEAVEELAA